MNKTIVPIELTLLVQPWVSQPDVRKEELSPLLSCHVGAWAGNRCLPMHRPTTPEAGERACPGVIKAGQQYLTPISCSARKSGLFTVPGQHSRTGPEGIGVGELILLKGKPENWPSPLLSTEGGELTRTMLESKA